jgi:hypothetical protein
MNHRTVTIADEPVKQFLDAVDAVLNSNTFILSFSVQSHDVLSSLTTFVNSSDFQLQLLKQDQDRLWHNLHLYNVDRDQYEARTGSVVKENCRLKITQPGFPGHEYLMAMITGDTTKGSFFSFYATQKTREEAEALVKALISFLFKDQAWQLFIVEPDFLWNAVERSPLEKYSTGEIFYFEGDNGNDSATVIASKDTGFLILTNGID